MQDLAFHIQDAHTFPTLPRLVLVVVRREPIEQHLHSGAKAGELFFHLLAHFILCSGSRGCVCRVGYARSRGVAGRLRHLSLLQSLLEPRQLRGERLLVEQSRAAAACAYRI